MKTFQVNVIVDVDDMVFKNGRLLAHKIHYQIDKKSIYEGSTISFVEPLAKDDIVQIVVAGSMYLFVMGESELKDCSSDVVQHG